MARFLLTNNHLDTYGGTETWVATMHDALTTLGHDVDVFCPQPIGEIHAHFTRFDPSTDYDAAFINHHTCLTALSSYPNIKSRVFTCHGVIPELERPRRGADHYVGVSEETAGLSKSLGFAAKVIRNPISLSIFREKHPINRKLQNILFLSTHGGKALDVVQEAADGYSLTTLGIATKAKNVEDYINDADLVIALGRGVYESLACKRNVIIFDYNGGDGFVDRNSIHTFNQRNCSGRTAKAMFTPYMLRELFDRYNPDLDLTDYIRDQHDSLNVAQKYISLATEVI